ncbi:MAG: hypothetical protein NC340_08020 [Ruminococcus flavefaciens]|nr:hypothetical protein [Ruminococcus flavefaciens]MCM1229924.1 hypothetical protein [Ruminococcus flavefaciens]
MMYLTKEELVKNIAEQTERACAVIEHTDFTAEKFNPNAVIIPFLGNIFDSALIVTALEDDGNSENDCHRNAVNLVVGSMKTKSSTRNFIRKIMELRQKYTLDSTEIPFDSDECLDFLNAYDCFMSEFIRNSHTVKELDILKFSSFRNKVEKLLKKNLTATENNSSADELINQLMINNRLMEKILCENQRINQRLDDIIKLIENGGNL